MGRSPRTVLGASFSTQGPAGTHICVACRAHRARYQYRGRVRADRDHDLCFRCFRAESNRLRARGMAAAARAERGTGGLRARAW